jgi:hypothetical protein
VLPESWASLVALLDGRPDTDPITRVQRLCALAVDVTALSGAALGIALNDTRSTVAATDEVSDRLQDLQTDFSEGPGLDAFRRGRSVLVPDLRGQPENRWPWFTPAAVDAGVRAVFAFVVRAGAVPVGSLLLYADRPGGLGAEQLQDARRLADAASVLLALKQPGQEAAEAFLWVVGDRSRFRAEVYQAVGATTWHLGVDVVDAYARICAHSYATGQPIAQVAADIMAGRLRLVGEQG